MRKYLPRSLTKKIDPVVRCAQALYGFSIKYGHAKTALQWKAVDQAKNEIPWYTYPAIEYLSALDLTNLSVFEYGSGNSTIWWAGRCKYITSVESDPSWFEKVDAKLHNIDNVRYSLVKDEKEYVHFLKEHYDIVVVDGRLRYNCVEETLKIDPSLIIVDNSDWHPNTIELIRQNGMYLEIDFHGFGPINSYSWTTTLFIKNNLKEKLRYSTALKSACGLVQSSQSDVPKNFY